MNKITKFLRYIPLLISFPVMADYIPNTEPTGSSNQESSSTQQDLVNLGGYLGYVIGTPPKNISDTLLDYTSSSSNQELYEQGALIALFGAQPVATITSMLTYFVPPSASNSSTLNDLANVTNTAFGDYGTASMSYPSVVRNVDAPTNSSTYASDPTSQALINLLTTNDYSVCNSQATQSSSSSSTSYPISTPTCLSQATALETILNLAGTGPGGPSTQFPGTNTFGSYSYVQSFLGQVNANVVLSPLLYTNNSSSNNTSTTNSSSSAYNGLPSSNQEDQAADFIRYAIGIPAGLATASSYSSMWNSAFPNGIGNIAANQSSTTIAAQEALASYLVNLRTYAARSSVPISNLYQIFAKREPQPLSFNNTTTSQALSEFQMATWRIYDAQNQQNNQWVDQINNASAATVNKEIAILLSEINYQLYLTRQIAERQLMTTSVALLTYMGTGPILQQTNYNSNNQ